MCSHTSHRQNSLNLYFLKIDFAETLQRGSLNKKNKLFPHFCNLQNYVNRDSVLSSGRSRFAPKIGDHGLRLKYRKIQYFTIIVIIIDETTRVSWCDLSYKIFWTNLNIVNEQAQLAFKFMEKFNVLTMFTNMLKTSREILLCQFITHKFDIFDQSLKGMAVHLCTFRNWIGRFHKSSKNNLVRCRNQTFDEQCRSK